MGRDGEASNSKREAKIIFSRGDDVASNGQGVYCSGELAETNERESSLCVVSHSPWRLGARTHWRCCVRSSEERRNGAPSLGTPEQYREMAPFRHSTPARSSTGSTGSTFNDKIPDTWAPVSTVSLFLYAVPFLNVFLKLCSLLFNWLNQPCRTTPIFLIYC